MRLKVGFNQVLRLSKFCHVINRGDNFLLFHSLNMEVVFLLNGFVDIIQGFKYGKSVKSVLDKMPLLEEEKTVFVQLINSLLNFKMLVKADYDENKELLDYQRMHLPGPAVNLMYLILTDQCNYACSYCYIEGAMPPEYKFSYMTKEMARARIRDFANWSGERKSRNKSILFYGGEPLLNKEVFKDAVMYIQQLKKENVLPQNTDISIITNGSLITKEIAGFIKDNGVKVGLSIDGSPSCNDSCRKFAVGGGTFDATFRGYSNLVEVGVGDVGISFTVGYHNVDSLLENTKYVIEKFSVKSLGYNILMDNENSIIATAEYAEKVSDAIIECFEYLREQGIYEDRVMRKVEFFTNKQVYPNDCAACGRQFVALPGGEIGPCQAFAGSKKHFSKKKKGFSIYSNPEFVEWANRSPLTMPQCYSCVALGLCGGGCPCRAEIRNGGIWSVDDIFCRHSRKTVEWVLNDFAKQNGM